MDFPRKISMPAIRGCLLDTQDLEAITSLAVDKVLALDFDGSHSVGGGRKSASRGEQLSVCLYQTISQQSIPWSQTAIDIELTGNILRRFQERQISTLEKVIVYSTKKKKKKKKRGWSLPQEDPKQQRLVYKNE